MGRLNTKIPPGEERTIDGIKLANHGPNDVYVGKIGAELIAKTKNGESTVSWEVPENIPVPETLLRKLLSLSPRANRAKPSVVTQASCLPPSA